MVLSRGSQRKRQGRSSGSEYGNCPNRRLRTLGQRFQCKEELEQVRSARWHNLASPPQPGHQIGVRTRLRDWLVRKFLRRSADLQFSGTGFAKPDFERELRLAA